MRGAKCVLCPRENTVPGKPESTLNGKDYLLGVYGSREAKQRYHRLLAEWEASGRSASFRCDPNVITIVEIVAAYLSHAKIYFGDGENSEYVGYDANFADGKHQLCPCGAIKLRISDQVSLTGGLRPRRILDLQSGALIGGVEPGLHAHGHLSQDRYIRVGMARSRYGLWNVGAIEHLIIHDRDEAADLGAAKLAAILCRQAPVRNVQLPMPFTVKNGADLRDGLPHCHRSGPGDRPWQLGRDTLYADVCQRDCRPPHAQAEPVSGVARAFAGDVGLWQ